MSKKKATLWLVQQLKRKVVRDDDKHEFLVKRTQNTTETEVGAVLSKSQVRLFIESNYCVNIS